MESGVEIGLHSGCDGLARYALSVFPLSVVPYLFTARGSHFGAEAAEHSARVYGGNAQFVPFTLRKDAVIACELELVLELRTRFDTDLNETGEFGLTDGSATFHNVARNGLRGSRHLRSE